MWVGGGKQFNRTADPNAGPESAQDTFLPLRQRLDCFKRIEELQKKFGPKYRTNEVIKLEEESKYLMMAQRMLRTLSLSVDLNAAGNFQRYVVGELQLGQHRAGIMYGRVDEQGHAFCDAIYEPPQEGDAVAYRLKTDAAAADERARADRIAALLGLRPVGLIFTAKSRKCILSSQDIMAACNLQKEMEDACGYDFARSCVAASITRNETTGAVVFEAYQLSDLCTDMHRRGFFAEPTKPNRGYSNTTIEILVERKGARKVDNDFFLSTVPIKTHSFPLFANREADFGVENRPGQTQNALEVKHILKCHEKLPLSRRISDLHMLLYLSRFLDPVLDMPAICKAVVEGGPIQPGHAALIESLAQL